MKTIIRILFVSIVLIILFGGCQDNHTHSLRNQGEIMNESLNYYKAKQYDDAFNGFEDLCYNDNIGDACYYAGNCLHETLNEDVLPIFGDDSNRFDRMIEFYKKGCELGSENACTAKNKSYTFEKITSFLYYLIISIIVILVAGPIIL